MQNKKGFTIVELVIVIAVIAVLAAVLIPTFADVISKAKDSKATQEAKNAYTQFMIENAQEGDLAQLYIFKADKKRFVAIRDGVPQGIFSSRDEALRSLTDDPEYYLYKTTVKNLFGVKKGSIIVDNDGSDDTPSTFEEIKLKYGDHYFGGDANDRTVVSSEVKVYLRGGEGLERLDHKYYEVEIVASQTSPLDGTVFLLNSAPADGWYGIVIRKSDDSAFDFENGDSDLLSYYVKISSSMRAPVGSSGVSPVIYSVRGLYLHTGDVIKLKDDCKDEYLCKAQIMQEQYPSWNFNDYDLEVTPEGLVIAEDGWYAFRLKSTQNYIIHTKDGINLYSYVTIESPDNG